MTPAKGKQPPQKSKNNHTAVPDDIPEALPVENAAPGDRVFLPPMRRPLTLKVQSSLLPDDPYSMRPAPDPTVDRLMGIFDSIGAKREEFSFILNARLYLSLIVFPELQKYADKSGTPIAPYIRGLVRQNKNFVEMMGERGLKELSAKLHQPQYAFALTQAKKYVEGIKDADIIEGTPWWIDRVKETRIDLYDVLSKEPNGVKWFAQMLIECANILKGA